MVRKTLVFGNGLGMALDPSFFSLSRALQETWEEEGFLSAEEKQLIEACLPENSEFGRPSDEDDLDLLQRVLISCDFLRRIEIGENLHWLSDQGRRFPRAIRMFVHKVASAFHSDDKHLPDTFCNSLIEFLRETKSHVATLNYDQLLYDPFVDQAVLQGYNGVLIDGFLKSGYSADNMHRHNEARLGWYMHLHGSPLFYEEREMIKKRRRCDFDFQAIETTHIVLTHIKHKSSVIASSSVLSEYWQFLEMAIDESEEIILFGYSGYDRHLNERVSRLRRDKTVRVVEWDGSDGNRENFWREKLGGDSNVVQLENILDFNDW